MQCNTDGNWKVLRKIFDNLFQNSQRARRASDHDNARRLHGNPPLPLIVVQMHSWTKVATEKLTCGSLPKRVDNGYPPMMSYIGMLRELTHARGVGIVVGNAGFVPTSPSAQRHW
jgi:hypothetical protein